MLLSDKKQCIARTGETESEKWKVKSEKWKVESEEWKVKSEE